ncbi:MAG TPA: PilN domain-containing protein [Stellaceae bacterium]|jgi:general secretion pathway protein L|nr:PilN domain-containing protein [Stellaceae bacterium]
MSIAANHSIESARAWTERALRWWIGELRAACGDVARRLRELRGNAITIEASEHHWLVRRGKQPLGSLDSAALGSGVLRDLLGSGAPAASVTVEIPPERVLSKTINLPPGAEGRLDRILGFEISRHFPFAAERVFFSHRLVTQPGNAASPSPAVAVEIAAVPREIVFAIADDLAAAGLRATAFALVPAPGGTPLLLAPDPLIPTIAAWRPRRGVLVALALLALTAVISWPAAQQFRLAAIDRDITALKPAAEAALRARTVRQRAVDQAAAIAGLRATRPPLVAVLDLVSREVPDGAWLISLSVNGRDVVIDGLAPSAAAIALALQRDPKLSDISFRSPIARDAATGLEHFQLGAVLAGTARAKQ